MTPVAQRRTSSPNGALVNVYLAGRMQKSCAVDADTSFRPRDENLARLNERPASRGKRAHPRRRQVVGIGIG
jgi:hypothetical protein